ncbi:magnesium protoporphyrin IX methyltransferase [Porphyrobacter sp. LM 6]|jgi:magnesium-protoporphyrin O-methyltransferase|uniref:magnesium protoporphyrin IX methyltransferase n=1 Tax=Porphyrobacter sp. LM 6 TaxID=1896196 RepID=UPI000846D22A|nr:magnesium protoporphyrin IX methyltransferase [Porphyrobacter sp. LM 6]AOL95598.1 Mg-protoporphyrin IX methyltransferase [Porphyrobacter sp. LM 6]
MATRLPSEYDDRREALATYFDSTARQAWIDLTSDAKVSGIRATVRAGREAMRATLLDWLPLDLRRTRVLDAGCGTGAFAIAAACRGAEVTGIDVAAGLVDVARERTPSFIGHGRIHWRSGDMLDSGLGTFAHVVAMDSLIHYQPDDLVDALSVLAERTTNSILFTFAPRTTLLAAMHNIGKVFPKSDRSPAIVPVAEDDLRARLSRLSGWSIGRTERIASGFYTSQALELVRHG